MAPHGHPRDGRAPGMAGLRPLPLPPRPHRHEGHLHQGRRLESPCGEQRVSIASTNTRCYRSAEATMANLLKAAQRLVSGLASSVLFLAVLLITKDLILGVALGVVL